VPKSPEQQILALIRQVRVLRPRDLDRLGIARVYLGRLHAKGLLERPGRGLYVAANNQPTENQSLVEACKRVPQGVVCLLSALQFHKLTTQAPFEVWLALGKKAWAPKPDYTADLRSGPWAGQETSPQPGGTRTPTRPSAVPMLVSRQEEHAMRERVEVVYENGVLRPLGPLPPQVHEHQHFTITIDTPGALEGRLDDACVAAAKRDADPTVSLEEVRGILAKVPGTLAGVVIAERAER